MDVHTELCAYFLGKLTGIRGVQAFAGLSDQDAARFVAVSQETFRRWRSDRVSPLYAMRMLAIRGGFMPWPDWYGWLIRDGKLYSPGATSGGMTPGMLEAYQLRYQQVSALEREVRELREKLHEVELAKARTVAGVSQGVEISPHLAVTRVARAPSRNATTARRKSRRQRRTSSPPRSIRLRAISNA
jgi:hypothetical protein